MEPLVSCVMVTRNRAALARRALACLDAQTWPNLELVVIDDGDEDYEPVLGPLRARCAVRYVRLHGQPRLKLGELRNMALSMAAGTYVAQWDDDEWYHPTRVARQMEAIRRQDLDAVVLKWTLMHMDVAPFGEHLYRADLGRGTPGTILHRRAAAPSYPALGRDEDGVFLRRLGRVMRLGMVDGPHSHLFIRCFHGGNTWDRAHFLRRLRRTPAGLFHYLKARFIHRDLRRHPAFRLTDPERQAADRFLAQSRTLGLMT
jgi:glycosyltransferase involved in cell wall biosynthesis